MPRKWLVFAAVSLMFFFVTGSTFMSLGVVLYSMLSVLHWSQTAAGSSFAVLGLACCLSSPLPAVLMNRIGTRWTMLLGGALLSMGFVCAYNTQGIGLFYCGMALTGVGFSLGANIPGVYLLASWFPERPARIIGLYLMFGAFGGVAGPPVATWMVSHGGGWRMHWLLMAVLAAISGLICLVCIEDRPPEQANKAVESPSVGANTRDWVFREAALTPQFMIIAAAMVLTQACVTTVQSAGVSHLAALGQGAAFAALMLSLQSMVATLAKGATGTLAELINPKRLLGAGLVLQCLGLLLLAHTHSHAGSYGFAVAFGAGWGAAYLAVTVLLIEYFGPNTGSAVLSTVWLLTGVAAFGPPAAGWVDDHFGSFSPAFIFGGLILLPIALLVLLLRIPKPPSGGPQIRTVAAAERTVR
jgi:MFS family permease